MNPLKKLAGQTVVYGLSSVVGRLLNYLLVPLYTRFFTPEDYGVVTELYAYVAFLVILLTYGLETAFFRFSKTEKNTAKAYTTALISLIVTSCVFVFLALASSESIANFIGTGIKQIYIKYFAIIVALDAVSSITFAKLRQDEKAFHFATIKLCGVLVNIALNVYFILFKEQFINNFFKTNL